MSQKKYSIFLSTWTLFISSLLLVLPFVHLHPELTHSDSLDEHTHSAVVHTLFALDHIHDIHSSHHGEKSVPFETSEEFLRATIGPDLFPQRLSLNPAPNGLNTVLTLYASFQPYPSERSTLSPNSVSVIFSAWQGHTTSSRASPHYFFS